MSKWDRPLSALATLASDQVSFAPGLPVCVPISQEPSKSAAVLEPTTPQAIRKSRFEAAAHVSPRTQLTRRLIVLHSHVYTVLPVTPLP